MKYLLMACILVTSCSHTYKKMGKAIAGDHRSEKNIARNVYRNPKQTLKFFEVKPHHHVVEISPGGGWYTEVLGPYLREKGELTLAIFDDNAKRDFYRTLNKNLKEKIASRPDRYGKVNYSTLQAPSVIKPLTVAGTADRVLTFRNVHNWMKNGGTKKVFKEFFDALKPGGILGVVEHRAKMNRKQDPKAKSGYVREDYVIMLAEEAGFEFVAKSEVNANYLDSTDHPKGVWTLPPGLRMKDKNRRRYLAIGESDRMTLKFRKPKN